MPTRLIWSVRSLLALLVLLLAGCAGQGEPVVIPTVAQIPTVTPIPPTNTPVPIPPTWTPPPTLPPTCGQIIAAAGAAAPSLCGSAAVGEACYVAPRAALTARSVNAPPAFAAPGERAPLTLASRLDTGGYDPDSGTWGMILAQVRADPPEVPPGQWVTIVQFGEATIFDGGDGVAPFQSLQLHAGFGDPRCDQAPLPGALIQSVTGGDAVLAINGVSLRFDGTLLIRAQGQGTMQVTVLYGQAVATAPGGEVLEAPAGTEINTPLGGASGYVATGPVTLKPLNTANTAYLPLVALPRPVAIAPPALPTQAGPGLSQQVATYMPTEEALPTSAVPFQGTPPGGVYLTFGGKRIELGATVTGAIREGGSDSWVFTPHGLGPESVDYFEVVALGNWDPVLTLESATWGIYEENLNLSEGSVEVFSGPLAGSGGDWRITIRAAGGEGGSYTLRFACFGSCPEGAE